MSDLAPFKGLRPPRALAQKISAPPYDVVNTEEARAYAQGNPASFFHVSRPEIDLPSTVDEHADEVYALGLTHLREFLQRGHLKQDPEASFYVYRQRMGAHAQVGLVAGASVEEYDRGLIKKHELTRADKEDDRTRHIDTLAANDEPVFLTYRADKAIDRLIAEVAGQPPEYDFTSEDGVGHTFWVVKGKSNAQLRAAFQGVPTLYIADGHHRSAAASRVRKLRQGRGQRSPGQERFLAVVFPHDQMQILDYNRVVKDLAGLTVEAFLDKVREKFEVGPGSAAKPRGLHQFGMYLKGIWYQLNAKAGTFPATPLGVLDVSILQENLLQPVLRIGDPRTDKRISFVGGIRGTQELVKLVDAGLFEVAFSMFPTSLEQLMAIADAGQIMPPKSTWFEPKLRSGLVLHPFDDAQS